MKSSLNICLTESSDFFMLWGRRVNQLYTPECSPEYMLLRAKKIPCSPNLLPQCKVEKKWLDRCKSFANKGIDRGRLNK